MTEQILEQIDNIKEKISSQEYIDLMKTITDIHNTELYEVTMLTASFKKKYSKQINHKNDVETKILKLNGVFKLGDKILFGKDNIMIHAKEENSSIKEVSYFDLNHIENDDDLEDLCDCSHVMRLIFYRHTYISHKKIE